jgi:hypothetical protein
MPGLVKGHEHASASTSSLHEGHQGHRRHGGAKVLADAWLAGAFGGKDKCIKRPADAAGLKVRSAGSTFAADVGRCRRLHRVDPVQRGLQRSAAGRGAGHRHLDRQLRVVPPVRAAQVRDRTWRQRAVVHVRAGADRQEELGQAQRCAEEGADGRLAEGRGLFRAESKGLDDKMVETFKKNKVEVVTLSDADDRRLARRGSQKTSYKSFAEKVPGGKELIEKALSVK